MKELINRSRLYDACNGCEKRTDTCHAGCTEYAAEVILGVIVEANDRPIIKQRLDQFEVAQKRAYRMLKRGSSTKGALRNNPYVKSR